MTNALDRAATLDRARRLHRRLANALWAVDSAESLLRKAQPGTGYRSSEALGDKPWDVAEAKAAVDRAHINLSDVLFLIGLGALDAEAEPRRNFPVD